MGWSALALDRSRLSNAAVQFIHRHIRLIAVIYWIIIFAGTHIPAERMPDVGESDKFIHLAMFAGLGIVLYLALARTNPRRRFIVPLILLAGSVYAVLDELTQPLVRRYCDWRDMLADITGLCLAVGLCALLFRARRASPSRSSTVSPSHEAI